MPRYDATRHHRRSIRLRCFDYSSPGAYFVTVAVRHRQPLLGHVTNGSLCPSAAGRMVGTWWRALESRFPFVTLDAFVAMPDHIHGIVLLTDLVDPRGNVTMDASAKASLGTIIQWFKTMTTNSYLATVREGTWPPLDGGLWQRGYYEHVVRDAVALDRIRRYIDDNPRRWDSRTR